MINPCIQGIQGADHCLLGKDTGEHADCGRPVFLSDPERFKDRGYDLAGRCQRRLVGVLVAKSAVGAQGIEDGQHHDNRYQHLARLEEKGFEPVIRAQQDRTARGQVIGRHFHDEWRCFPFEQGVLEDQTGEHGKADADQIKEEHKVLAAGREEGRREQCIDRQARPAGHKGVHHNGQGAVTLVLQRTGGHDRRHIAAKADQHRHEGLAGQADEAHEPVHDKGGAGHVTGVFQKRKAEKHEADGRNEGGHGLDAAADARRQDGDQPLRGVEMPQQIAQAVHKDCAGQLIEKVDESAAHIDGDHEHQVHGQQKDGDAKHMAKHHTVDTVGQGGADLTLLCDQVSRQPGNKTVTSRSNDDIWFLFQITFDLGLQGADSIEGSLAERYIRQRMVIAFEQFKRQPVGIDLLECTGFL